MVSGEIMDKIHRKAADIVGETAELLKCIAVNDDNIELVAQCYANYHNWPIEEAREYASNILHELKVKIKQRKDLYEDWMDALKAEFLAAKETK